MVRRLSFPQMRESKKIKQKNWIPEQVRNDKKLKRKGERLNAEKQKLFNFLALSFFTHKNI
jgi:hypothetical protein